MVGSTQLTALLAAAQENLDVLTDLVQRLSLEAKDGTPETDLLEALGGLRLEPGPKPAQASVDAVEERLTIDSQEEVMKAVVDDLKEDLFDESLGNLADQILDSDDDDADSSAGDKPQAVDTPRSPPYTKKVASQFGDLEGEAEKCNMAEVSYHLRKAKLAWMREFGWRKTKQTIMADFL